VLNTNTPSPPSAFRLKIVTFPVKASSVISIASSRVLPAAELLVKLVTAPRGTPVTATSLASKAHELTNGKELLVRCSPAPEQDRTLVSEIEMSAWFRRIPVTA
jgi:hypothetical protein